MKAGGGKAKGASFERLICTKLSLWLTSGEEEDLLWRSAMSGGRATVARKKGVSLESQSSDITATKSLGEALTSNFSIECKFYASLNVEGFVFGAKAGLQDFWDQVQKDAAVFGKLPMLIAKQNRKPVLLALDADGVSFFKDLYGKIPVHFICVEAGMHILFFDQFLEFADPEPLLELHRHSVLRKNAVRRRPTKKES